MDVRRKLGVSINAKIIKRKPTHGPCYTCQVCGFYHDDCKCLDNNIIEVSNYVKQLQAENGKLKKALQKYGKHKIGCGYSMMKEGWSGYSCTCGLQALNKKED